MSRTSPAQTRRPKRSPPTSRKTRGPSRLGVQGRFWAKVNKTPTCWLWTASTRQGYGHFRIGQSHHDAHRLAYQWAYGDPGGLCVLHRCDVRACVRPDHLFLGTKATNTADMVAKGRARGARPKLTREQVAQIRQRHARGDISQAALAREFAVSKMTICKLLRYETYR